MAPSLKIRGDCQNASIFLKIGTLTVAIFLYFSEYYKYISFFIKDATVI